MQDMHTSSTTAGYSFAGQPYVLQSYYSACIKFFNMQGGSIEITEKNRNTHKLFCKL